MSNAVRKDLRTTLNDFANDILSKAQILDDEVDETLFRAFASVPRHLFVDESLLRQSYTDYALPLEFGQIISKPSVVARMMSLVGIKKGMRVLEVGSGSGYTAALMSSVGVQVFGMEESGFLAQKTRHRLDALQNANILIGRGDGMKGWSEYAPFDAILVWTPCTRIDDTLISQLKTPAGRLVAPIGDDNNQTLYLWETDHGEVIKTKLERCNLLEGHD